MARARQTCERVKAISFQVRVTQRRRVVNVRHLQQVLGAAILLHLNGLSAPLCGYAVIFGEVCVRRHLEVTTLEDDLVDVVLVSLAASDNESNDEDEEQAAPCR